MRFSKEKETQTDGKGRLKWREERKHCTNLKRRKSIAIAAVGEDREDNGAASLFFFSPFLEVWREDGINGEERGDLNQIELH
jgi:hypothetical protein